jgi:hypothetical protein
MEGGAVGHNFEMGLPKDYPCQGSWEPLVFRLNTLGSIITKQGFGAIFGVFSTKC